MNFLNPLVLLGLAAAGIPVLIHLLNLRRQKTIEFSSLRFLKELQKTKIRKLKIKQILLLIIRTLLVIFAVLAFARPAIQTSIPGFTSYANSSIVVLVDNTYSMELSDENGRRLNQAKLAVQEIISNLQEGDEIAIVELADRQNIKNLSLSRNFTYIKDQLQNLKIEATLPDMVNGLKTANNLLEQSKNLNKLIYIISDGQKNIFHNLNDSVKYINQHSLVSFVQIGNHNADIKNLSVDSVNLKTKIFSIGKLIETEAKITNHSKTNSDNVVVSLIFNDERVAQRTLDIPAGESRTLAIAAAAKESGAIKARIEIENDALDIDNKRYFGFAIPDKIKIAVLGSDNEFIKLAFAGIDPENKTAEVNYLQDRDLASLDLSNFELVLLASGSYRKSDFDRIQNYVNEGGSLLLFALPELNPQLFQSTLTSFGFGNLKINELKGGQVVEFSSTDKLHPLFEGVFEGSSESNKIVESAKIGKSFSVDAGLKIIEVPNGTFLSESRIGNGKILYFSVTPNLDWSNFPLTGLFPTLLYRSVVYLSAGENYYAQLNVNEPSSLILPKDILEMEQSRLQVPVGISLAQATILPSSASLNVDNFNIPGTYVIQNSNDKILSIVSVNTSASESSSSYLDEAKISENIKKSTDFPDNFSYLNDYSEISDVETRATLGTELWQLFILLSLLCALAEMIVQKSKKFEGQEA